MSAFGLIALYDMIIMRKLLQLKHLQ